MSRIAMSKFNDFKAIVFSDPGAQYALTKAIRSKGYSAKNFDEAFEKLVYKVEEQDLQTLLAPYLRALAIKHLREGTTEFVREFKSTYDVFKDSSYPNDHAKFCDQQSRAGVYATNNEAIALAEVLRVRFACTQVNAENFASGPPYIHNQSIQEDAPTIHLFYRPDDHFFVVEGQYGSTVGDGNCLYNGFAQLIRQFIFEEELRDITIYVDQQAIYNKIKNLPPMPILELLARVRMHHQKEEDVLAFQAAVELARQDKIGIHSDAAQGASLPNGNETRMPIEEKLLSLIRLIGDQGRALSTKVHRDEAMQLATTLESEAKTFFGLPSQEKQHQFCSFKEKCLQAITNAKSLSNRRDYQQIFLDIIQTLTVIGALLGVVKWAITGRYSLFPTKKTTLSDTIENTKQTITGLS